MPDRLEQDTTDQEDELRSTAQSRDRKEKSIPLKNATLMRLRRIITTLLPKPNTSEATHYEDLILLREVQRLTLRPQQAVGYHLQSLVEDHHLGPEALLGHHASLALRSSTPLPFRA